MEYNSNKKVEDKKLFYKEKYLIRKTLSIEFASNKLLLKKCKNIDGGKLTMEGKINMFEKVSYMILVLWFLVFSLQSWIRTFIYPSGGERRFSNPFIFGRLGILKDMLWTAKNSLSTITFSSYSYIQFPFHLLSLSNNWVDTNCLKGFRQFTF